MSQKNLQTEINRVLAQGISLQEFLAALSIPLVGDGVTRKITAVKISDITYDSLRKDGVGDKAATNLVLWISMEWDEIFKERPRLVRLAHKPSSVTTLNKGDVCITGKLTNFTSRKVAAEHLETLGWTVKASLTKSVKYLISEDGNTASSSYKKALGNGIEVITINDLEDK